jgi:hypothetical protein
MTLHLLGTYPSTVEGQYPHIPVRVLMVWESYSNPSLYSGRAL